jgi:hypothetical protein
MRDGSGVRHALQLKLLLRESPLELILLEPLPSQLIERRVISASQVHGQDQRAGEEEHDDNEAKEGTHGGLTFDC